MANTVSFEIKGSKELDKKLRALGGPLVLEACGGGLYRSAEMVMTLSKSKYVPVDVGNLMGSGHVTKPEIQGKSVLVTTGFGGPAGSGNHGGSTNQKDVGYAVYVHEMNKNYNNGRQWKYLETPLKESVPDIEKELKASIEDAFETLA